MGIHTWNPATMLGYWPIDEAAGSFIDAGGTYTAAPGLAPAREAASTPWGAYAALYNADSQVMEVADDGAIATLVRGGTFSITFWAKVNSAAVTRGRRGFVFALRNALDDSQILFSATVGTGVLDPSGMFGAVYKPQAVSLINTETYGYTMDAWHHYAIVVTATGGGLVNIDHYADAVLQYSAVGSHIPDALGSMLLRFGRNYDDVAQQLDNELDGRLSEVVLWKSALSADDVLADYNLAQPPPIPVQPGAPEETSDGPELGIDIKALPDQDGRFRLQGGWRNLGEAIARRLQTPPGGLFYSDDYGFDLRDLLNEGFTQQGLFAAQAAVEAECEKDERVLSASATLTFNSPANSLTVAIELQTAAGPFQLVLTVDQVSVQILSAAA